MSQLKLRTRLVGGFGILLILMISMAVMASRQITVIHQGLEYYTATTTPSLAAVKSWQEKVSLIRMLQGQHLMTVSDEEMATLESTIDQVYKELNQALADHEKLLVNDEDREYWTAVKENTALAMTNWEKLKAISRQTLTDADKIEEARRLFTGKTERLFKATSAAIENEWGFKSKVATQLAEDGAKTYKIAMTMLTLTCLVSMVIGMGSAVLVVRSVMRQMGGEPSDVARIALSIAQGDLSVSIDNQASARHSVITAMATMRERLANLVSEVRLSSDSIATGSAEIATGNLDLSHRTEAQATDLQHTTSSMEQLTSTVKLNADTAEQASKLASDASTSAFDGGEAVSRVVTTMQDIAASSKTISDITGVIDGIAFQTNILALNAAVEAARAGEQGRGFAVVASEVRSLAHRSAEAAKAIKKLISDNVSKVEMGARQVNEAGVSIQNIVTQVQYVSTLIDGIYNAASQQYGEISEVTAAIGRIDQATMQNAALVEQSSAAADSLRGQAARLVELVRIFRLTADHDAMLPAQDQSTSDVKLLEA
jgi:methyl-accepting chemotaxis protein